MDGILKNYIVHDIFNVAKVLVHNMWPGQWKPGMYAQELNSLLLTNYIATLVHYPDTTTE